MRHTKWSRSWGAALLLVSVLFLASGPPARAESRQELTRDAVAALKTLYRTNQIASDLGKRAKAVLVFPSIIKAGFLFGGQMGDGVLLRNMKASGYYNTVAASYGLQAGVQTFGYALFFMDQSSLDYLSKSDGWEIGAGPSVVVVDKGAGKAFSSTTVSENVYAFIFSQKGLMGGLGVQGAKITKLD